ncbi:hypothetical protein [Microbacterium sp. TPD7012]|uniref:hypothetical protein n=1 Tax=Microbacterium sp. TPD7012 TaxID=2171975 RepID=UPI000D51723A|nr:hypothetical protein [Microbacterium sp. TPD7012]PVE94991.1 hypothetical protein DC434_13785 [Microbacterium sp. TPD7012]
MTLEKFHHTVGKQKITLPKFDQVFTTFGEVREFRRLDSGEQMFALIEKAADAANLKKIDALTVPEVKDLLVAWQRDAGVTVGESSASATS